MSTTITKIGNSQGVRINKTILEKMGLKVNDKVEIEVVEDEIIIKKVAEQYNDIYELFADYKSDGLHEPLIIDEDTVGREIW